MKMGKSFTPSMTFRILAIVWLAAAGIAWAHTDAKLLARADDAFTERTRLRKEADQGFRTAVWDQLSDLSSDERTRAIILWMQSLDQYKPNDPRTTQPLTYAIRDDPRLVENEDEFRKMLREEEDPRKFYLISSIASHAVELYKYDFVAARSRMLLRDGAVAKPAGEFNPDYIHDVSILTYSSIVYNLRKLGAEFEEPDKELLHEEKVKFLVSWLRENWPGCATLGLRESPESRVDPREDEATGKKSPVAGEASPSQAENQASRQSALWVAIAVLVLALGIYLIGRKRKS